MHFKSNIRPRRSFAELKKKFDEHSDDDTGKKGTIGAQFNEYLLNTSLHGLKYVGDRSISNSEKVFFASSFALVVIMSAYFISNVWEKWSETPVIISLNPTATQLKNIPFPAVTICNMNQARKSIATNYDEDSNNYQLLNSLCYSDDTFNGSMDFIGKWVTFRKFLLDTTQSCNQLIQFCRFSNAEQNCEEVFSSVLTDEGICCTFNGVDHNSLFKNQGRDSLGNVISDTKIVGNSWTPETGFPPNYDKTMRPRRAAGAGSHLGLTVMLDANVKDYYCSSTNSAGFKILLHSPVETPKISDYGLTIATGMETRIVVTPKISDATNLIRRISKNLRQCIFENEANLTYFNIYSKKNCEMECEARFTQRECGCILYYMPRISEEVNICSRKDAKCYEQIKLALDLSNNESYSCSCMPGCYEISYGKDISAANIWDGSFAIPNNKLESKDPKYVKNNIALVHIFFVDSAFRSFTKGELIGFTEFLSNTGGLLGLFMGFSVLSLVEILYYMSLRPFCIHKRLKSSNNVFYIKNVSRENSPQEIHNSPLSPVWATLKGGVEKLMDRIKNLGTILKSTQNPTGSYQQQQNNLHHPRRNREERDELPRFPYYE